MNTNKTRLSTIVEIDSTMEFSEVIVKPVSPAFSVKFPVKVIPIIEYLSLTKETTIDDSLKNIVIIPEGYTSCEIQQKKSTISIRVTGFLYSTEYLWLRGTREFLINLKLK